MAALDGLSPSGFFMLIYHSDVFFNALIDIDVVSLERRAQDEF